MKVCFSILLCFEDETGRKGGRKSTDSTDSTDILGSSRPLIVLSSSNSPPLGSNQGVFWSST